MDRWRDLCVLRGNYGVIIWVIIFSLTISSQLYPAVCIKPPLKCQHSSHMLTCFWHSEVCSKPFQVLLPWMVSFTLCFKVSKLLTVSHKDAASLGFLPSSIWWFLCRTFSLGIRWKIKKGRSKMLYHIGWFLITLLVEGAAFIANVP